MKIYIDPQHGGVDRGVEHNGICEKNVALSTGVTLRNFITGHKVLMSRESDILAIENDPERTHGPGSIDTQYRADQANKNKVNLFIGLGLYDTRLKERYKTNGTTPIILTLHRTQLINAVIEGINGIAVVEYDKVLFKPFLGMRDPYYYQLTLLNMEGLIILTSDISTLQNDSPPMDIIGKLANNINSIDVSG